MAMIAMTTSSSISVNPTGGRERIMSGCARVSESIWVRFSILGQSSKNFNGKVGAS
jgi:hypothetical protein